MKVDDYVLDVLMRDLVGHDRTRAAFLIYLHLWYRAGGKLQARIPASHREIAEAIGLSKTAVQHGIRRLLDRRLVQSTKKSATATPVYRILTPWRR